MDGQTWLHDLPITPLIPDVAQALCSSPVVLEAPPGAGKSTALPLSLLHHPDYQHQRIIMLQPRRVAALSIAKFLSACLGEAVGQTVGYHIRGDRKFSSQTRLLIVTEGMFTRMIQNDPELAGTGLVIFDEFHERHLHSDLGLAMMLETMSLRHDLKLLVMSATIPAKVIADWLGNAVVMTSAGRQYPIKTHYRPPQMVQNWQQSLPKVVAEAIATAQQGVLVFLPGRTEINRLHQALESDYPALLAPLQVHHLHGQISIDKQQAAVADNATDGGMKKLVLATNIAETSLTLAGIDCVVDSGRVRQAHYYPQHGITRLLTRRISRAAAAQREGRAGRTGPGLCYRLWGAEESQGFADYAPAEIATQDLTQLLLECKAWGAEAADMLFLTPPNHAHLQVAAQLLERLGATTNQGALTPIGQQVLNFGGDPRLARMAGYASQQAEGVRRQAALLAAFLENPPQDTQVDLCTRLEQVASGRDALTKVLQQRWRWWQRRLDCDAAPTQFDDIPQLLLWAFPDRVALRQGKSGAFKLSYGGQAKFAEPSLDSFGDLLIVPILTLQEGATEAVMRWVVPCTERDLAHPQLPVVTGQEAAWHGQHQRLQLFEVKRIGALLWSRKALTETKISPAQRLQALQDYVVQQGLQVFTQYETMKPWLQRIALLYKHLPEQERALWPDFSEGSLLVTLAEWAQPYWQDIQSLAALKRWNPLPALQSRLNYAQQQQLEAACPTQWRAPSGRLVSIDYTAPEPQVALKLQEAFGEPVSPRIVYGKVILTLDLLSPAGRLLQRTRDLQSFWTNAYQDVKKEMKGRYPKHPWPDDPTQAQATHKTKRQLNS